MRTSLSCSPLSPGQPGTPFFLDRPASYQTGKGRRVRKGEDRLEIRGGLSARYERIWHDFREKGGRSRTTRARAVYSPYRVVRDTGLADVGEHSARALSAGDTRTNERTNERSSSGPNGAAKTHQRRSRRGYIGVGCGGGGGGGGGGGDSGGGGRRRRWRRWWR